MPASNIDISPAQSSRRAPARDRRQLSIVCPCYNESAVIELFYQELASVLETVREVDAEVIFVDDGSDDDTLAKLNDIAAADARVRVCSFSRNFGHQIALTAGLDHAKGDAVVMIDCDLQQPQSLIGDMVEKWREGYDIVSAVRLETKGASLFKRLSSTAFYFVLNSLSNTRIPRGVADFCLVSRRVCVVLQSMRERHRFLRGMISWAGFERAFIPFEANERPVGKSKYTLVKMITMGLDAALSFSTVPMRLATRIGLLITVLGFAYLAWNLIKGFWFAGVVPGWASLIGLTMVLGGSQLIFIGVIGQYLARVFEESKGRPIYIVKQEPRDSALSLSPEDDA